MEGLIIFAAILFMSFTYLLIGFGINQKNAKYFLAGYNTMAAEKKEHFDIDNYLKFFKSFFKKLFLFPPLSFVLFSIFLEGDSLIVIWSLAQVGPFVLFQAKSSKYH
jgi:hypothetical protein